MNNLHFKTATLCVAVNSILLMTATAYAADSYVDADSLATNDELPSAIFPTIVVMAQTENYTVPSTTSATGLDLAFKENPKSVTVVTEEFIEDNQANNIKDIVKVTPGIHVQQTDASRSSFSARGFDIGNFNVDGQRVEYNSGWGEGAGLSTSAIYDKVEVVRGADGLMNGSGNPSATINLVRKHADSVDISGEVSATYDRFDGYGATIDIGSRLNESGSIRGRAIVNYTDGDTYIDREDKSNKTAYVVVDADITEDTTASIGGMRQERIQDEVMWGALPIFYTDGSRIDWDTNQNMAMDWSKRDGITDEVFASVEHNLNEDWWLKLSGNYAETEGDMKLFYANGYVYEPNGLLISGIDSATGLPIPATPSTLVWLTDTKEMSLSAKLNGDYKAFGRDHKLMFGADYIEYETKASRRPGSLLEPITGVVDDWDGNYPEPQWGDKSLNNDVTTKEQALYGATQLQLTDALSTVLGARVSDYETNGFWFKNLDIEHDSEWTPFAGITYDINDNNSVYASYTDIFEPQTQRKVDGEFLDPIIGKNFEVGVKSTNDAQTLQSQFSVFKIEQDNLAQVDAGKFVTDTIEQAYYAAEGATSTGIDVEVSGQINDNWQASLGYTHFNNEDANDQAVNTEYPTTLIKLFTTYDLSNTVPGLKIGGGVNWMNERYTTIANQLRGGATEKLSDDPVTLVNLMAKYEVNDNLDLQLNLDNVLDEKYINSFGFSQIAYAEPFNVKAKLSYKW